MEAAARLWTVDSCSQEVADVHINCALCSKLCGEDVGFPIELVKNHKLTLESSITSPQPLGSHMFPIMGRLALVHTGSNEEVRTPDGMLAGLVRERSKGKDCVETLDLSEPACITGQNAKVMFDNLRIQISSGCKKKREISYQFLLIFTFGIGTASPGIILRSPPFTVRAKTIPTALKQKQYALKRGREEEEASAAPSQLAAASRPTQADQDIWKEVQSLRTQLATAWEHINALNAENCRLKAQAKRSPKRVKRDEVQGPLPTLITPNQTNITAPAPAAPSGPSSSGTSLSHLLSKPTFDLPTSKPIALDFPKSSFLELPTSSALFEKISSFGATCAAAFSPRVFGAITNSVPCEKITSLGATCAAALSPRIFGALSSVPCASPREFGSGIVPSNLLHRDNSDSDFVLPLLEERSADWPAM